MRSPQAAMAAVRSARIRSKSAGMAHRSQFSSGRQVGCGKEMATNFPRTVGSQAWKAAGSARSGSSTASPVTAAPPVPGLQASIVPSSERTRGLSRSTWVWPRLQPRQVP